MTDGQHPVTELLPTNHVWIGFALSVAVVLLIITVCFMLVAYAWCWRSAQKRRLMRIRQEEEAEEMELQARAFYEEAVLCSNLATMNGDLNVENEKAHSDLGEQAR